MHMTSRVPDPRRPFGRLLTAMVTPMRPDGSLDLDGAVALATHLVDEQANDALVVAGATGLPMLVYDIPHRTGTPIATETLCRLAEHDRIVGVKDAKSDLAATAAVTRRTDLAYYCGEDALTLPSLAVGGVGVVGTS